MSLIVEAVENFSEGKDFFLRKNGIFHKGIVTLDNRFPIWGDFQTPNQEIWTNMINPFNYNDINTWKGCYK